MRNGMILGVLGLSLMAAAPTGLRAADAPVETKEDEGEVKVKMEDCPKAVQETLKKEAGSGTIKEIVRETEKGKLIYSADVVIDSKPYEINIAEDGTLISKEIDTEDDTKDGQKGDKKGEHKDDDKDEKK